MFVGESRELDLDLDLELGLLELGLLEFPMQKKKKGKKRRTREKKGKVQLNSTLCVWDGCWNGSKRKFIEEKQEGRKNKSKIHLK